MGENATWEGELQGVCGLCVLTKSNAWKFVSCGCVKRRMGRTVSHFLVEVKLKSGG